MVRTPGRCVLGTSSVAVRWLRPRFASYRHKRKMSELRFSAQLEPVVVDLPACTALSGSNLRLTTAFSSSLNICCFLALPLSCTLSVAPTAKRLPGGKAIVATASGSPKLAAHKRRPRFRVLSGASTCSELFSSRQRSQCGVTDSICRTPQLPCLHKASSAAAAAAEHLRTQDTFGWLPDIRR